jgi:hypothetical protein
MNISLPSSGYKNKPRKKSAEAGDKIRDPASAGAFLDILFFLESQRILQSLQEPATGS